MQFNSRQRFGARWTALRLLCTTFPRQTPILALACLFRGAVPAAFALAVGGVVSAIPDAARDGLDSLSGQRLLAALGIAAVILLLGEALGIPCAIASDNLYRLFDEAVLARVMRAVLAPPGIGHLEDPRQQQRVALALRAARFGPGEFVSGMSEKWQAQATGLSGVVLVAAINLPAALALCVIWLAIGVQVTTSRYRAYPFWSEPLKRASYLRDLGLEPHAAKEVRLFGLADWLVGQYAGAWQEVMHGLWVTRRADFRLASVLVARLRDRIRFEAVRFGYTPTSRPVLDGFELEIPAGHSLAVVGANGAGKTTLLKLLLGLYQPLDGQISIDGRSLSQLNISAWLESASGDERLQRSAERAGALQMIEALPRGFDTILSRRFAAGVELSGGQWQRMALARALFAVEGGATLLMLDEPTAHLDVRAELDLFDRFLELTAGLTTIVVSHRFSTVRRADRIAVIEDGRVAEVGSHAELLLREGHYARMFRAQAATFHA